MPETRTTTETVYKLSELEPKAKQAALEKLAEWAVDHDWWDFVVDDAKRMGAILGIEAEHIYFSGFWSQGDGACFVGTYSYAKGSCRAIRTEAPEDTELHRIADTLREIQRRNFYRLTASVTHRGRYSHEHSVEIDVDTPTAQADDDEAIRDALRAFMKWVYRQLETEHDYHTSEAQLIEMNDANDYRWLEDGRPA